MELPKLEFERPSVIKRNQPDRYKTLVWACALFLCLPVLFSLQAKAQTLYGSVVGTVTDNTGAAVPDAKVVITDTQTNDSRTVVTDNGGVYTVSTVPAGNYQVTITKQGFEGYKTNGIDVTANNVVRVDAQLQVGAVSQTVEVQSAVAAQLQTDTADVHSEISSQHWKPCPRPREATREFLTRSPA